MPRDPISSVAGSTTRGTAATSNKDYQQLSPHGVDGVSTQDAVCEQNQTMDRDLYVEDAQQLQTKHSSVAAITSEGAEENARLRAKIQQLQSDAEAEQITLDNMFVELTRVEEELQDTKARLADTESECEGLRATLAQAGGSGHGAVLGNSTTTIGRSSPVMQQTILDLTASLRIKDESLKTKEADLVNERTTQIQLSQTPQSTLEQVVAQTHMCDAVVLSQNETGAREYSNSVGELQQHVRFFKANSERLAQIVRDLKDQNWRLSEDLEVKQRELEDVVSMNLVLKMQAAPEKEL
ncbi:hypothetical protein Sste5346_006877 [Sporothrix stenoceras]|uniref:Uncharacterized protein n=1 Tax=Sporothrix stenoceras TaxID=5173 RepID=A0ABR3YX22_9PEZI